MASPPAGPRRGAARARRQGAARGRGLRLDRGRAASPARWADVTVDRVLPPVEGSDEAVRALAATLTSGAARLSSIAAVLAGIRGGASWESPAGEAFGAAVRSS